MSKKYYEYNENGSNKFWEISKSGSKITTRWGKIGANGNILTKDYGDKVDIQYNKLIKSKLNKGYILSKNSKKSMKTLKKSVNHKGKTYFIHDNGGRPFLVVIDKKNVNIYKVPKKIYDENLKNILNENFKDLSKNKSNYSELIKEYKNVKQIFIGKSSSQSEMARWSGGYGKNFDGNSILIEIKDKQYCYIGNLINEFTTKDKIKKYESPVGGNDVPYPVAYSDESIYFFDFNNIKRLSKDLFTSLKVDDLWKNYYGDGRKGLEKSSQKIKSKLIHKRI